MSSRKLVLIKDIQFRSEKGQGNEVMLREHPESPLYFQMFVGDSEFAALAKEKGLFSTPRPLTHETYQNILRNTNVEFLRLEIDRLEENTFFAYLFYRINDTEHRLDLRPSDGVIMALNRGFPVLVHKRLMKRDLTPDEIKEFQDICRMVKF